MAKTLWAPGCNNCGFDLHATPRWVMVPSGASKKVFSFDGPNLEIRIVNPGIIDLAEHTPKSANPREFEITGKTPHASTYIEVVRPGARAGVRPHMVTRLEVAVKLEMQLSIAFLFVTDSLRVSSVARGPFPMTDLVDALNRVLLPQANITARMTRDANIDVDTNLLWLIRDQKDLEKIRPDFEWSKLAKARDPGADITVFFMPWSGPAAKRPYQAFGTEGVFVCPDGVPVDPFRLVLPHIVGLHRDCSITFEDKRQNDLMHYSNNRDDAPMAFDERGFIPKRSCADDESLMTREIPAAVTQSVP